MQQSSATPSLHLCFSGLWKIVACSQPYLAVLSCIYSFWHGVIPTSYSIFNDFYTCSDVDQKSLSSHDTTVSHQTADICKQLVLYLNILQNFQMVISFLKCATQTLSSRFTLVEPNPDLPLKDRCILWQQKHCFHTLLIVYQKRDVGSSTG